MSLDDITVEEAQIAAHEIALAFQMRGEDEEFIEPLRMAADLGTGIFRQGLVESGSSQEEADRFECGWALYLQLWARVTAEQGGVFDHVPPGKGRDIAESFLENLLAAEHPAEIVRYCYANIDNWIIRPKKPEFRLPGLEN